MGDVYTIRVLSSSVERMTTNWKVEEVRGLGRTRVEPFI